MRPSFVSVFYLSCLFLLFALLIWIFQPERSGWIIDADEELSAITALLYHQGFSFFSEIWSDQPPLFYIIFSWTFYLLEPSLETGRLLVILFGALLCTALFCIVRSQRGPLAGLVCALVLVASGRYLRLSGAVMIGVPALSLGICSLAFLSSPRRRSYGTVALSGSFFALGIFTKLFVVLFGPAIFIQLCIFAINDYSSSRSALRAVTPTLIWGSSTAFVLLALCLFFAPPLLDGYYMQLLGTHAKTRLLSHGNQDRTLVGLALSDTHIFLLVFLGLCAAGLLRRHEYLIPSVWFFTSILFLRSHHPIWVHHYLLYSIPASWIAGLAISELWTSSVAEAHEGALTGGSSRISSRYRVLTKFLLACILLGSLWATWKIAGQLRTKQADLSKIGYPISKQLLARLRELAPYTTLMVSDSPVYPFLLKARVVPELGKIPLKRLESGELSLDQIVSLIEVRKPEILLFRRFPSLRAEVAGHLLKTYRPDDTIRTILIRRDLTLERTHN